MKRFNCDFSSRFRILKGGKISLVVSALLGSVTLSVAAPSGESVVSGSVAIDRSIANTTNINQSTHKSIINWQDFSIGANETVNFNMPSSTSSSLNRVVGNNPSNIYGKLNSNGQVFLVNQNGVYFGQNSQVNTAGFVASTQNITDENFLNGNYIFEGNSEASILNFGTITTDNAYTALLAKTVQNEGVIKATLGNVQLASGEKFTLDINGNSLVKLTIDKGTLDGIVENKGAIYADGGQVYMTTQALDEVLNGLVNNTGVIEANTIEEKEGKIILFAHGGTGEFGGTLSTGKGEGFIETSGKEFVNKADLKIETGEWLIDPVNVTINETLATTVQNALENGNVTINTAGGNNPDTTSGEVDGEGYITVNSNITWSANKLTLQAHKDITINSILDISGGTAQLDLGWGWDGSGVASTDYNLASADLVIHGKVYAGNKTGTGHLFFGANDVTLINAMSSIPNSSSGRFALAKDIEASTHSPITNFSGRFDGLGNVISNLTVNHSDSGAGLFGSTVSGANLSNVRLSNVSVTNSAGGVGALIGNANGTKVFNAHADGTVTSTRADNTAADAGGLVGYQVGGSIFFSSANVNVTANGRNVGGLVGDATNSAQIQNSFALGDVQILGHQGNVGGLIGALRSSSSILNSYAKGDVSGQLNNASGDSLVTGIGGLVGEIRTADASIANSYATGTVTTTGSDDPKGGLVGKNAQVGRN
jgi:filamentous hemagglutinin family protein